MSSNTIDPYGSLARKPCLVCGVDNTVIIIQLSQGHTDPVGQDGATQTHNQAKNWLWVFLTVSQLKLGVQGGKSFK